ncbi:hypothetical protein DSL92_07105 [Billgrantia gudaonensis]|uniref:Uncharacterized protein n=1 Tax=Billgrantia gudaonensis TaxID=376427 RepID=A0A3S0NDR7_9GAMM|nr:hypothetical protein DSL92_07105 [Halomonas gudaonensis]
MMVQGGHRVLISARWASMPSPRWPALTWPRDEALDNLRRAIADESGGYLPLWDAAPLPGRVRSAPSSSVEALRQPPCGPPAASY